MRKVLMAVAVCLTMTACEKAIAPENGNDDGEKVGGAVSNGPTKKFTFTLKGDFSTEWKEEYGVTCDKIARRSNGDGISLQGTKLINGQAGEPFGASAGSNSAAIARRTAGYLQADGRDMTDVWVLDYMDGVLVQQIHQSDNTAEDFGKPVLNLAYGSHHVYFVASRGTTPTLNVGAHLITWERPSDTFYKDYVVDVVSTSNGNRAVTLERVVAKLKLTVTDEVAATCAEVAVTPSTWFYGWDYVGGAAVGQQQTERVVEVPSAYIGTTGQLAVSIYGLSGSTEWTTDVTIEARTAGHDVLGAATITSAPFKANRSTEYSGPLFGAGGAATLELSDEWMEAFEGTW